MDRVLRHAWRHRNRQRSMDQFRRLVECPALATRRMGYCAYREIFSPHLSRRGKQPLVRRRNLRLSYVELHAASAFSFLEGASLPEELIGACEAFGMPSMALLDHDGVYGAARFHLAAKKACI